MAVRCLTALSEQSSRAALHATHGSSLTWRLSEHKPCDQVISVYEELLSWPLVSFSGMSTFAIEGIQYSLLLYDSTTKEQLRSERFHELGPLLCLSPPTAFSSASPPQFLFICRLYHSFSYTCQTYMLSLVQRDNLSGRKDERRTG